MLDASVTTPWPFEPEKVDSDPVQLPRPPLHKQANGGV